MAKMPCQRYHIQRPYVLLFFLLTLTQIELWVQKFFIACCLVRFAAFFCNAHTNLSRDKDLQNVVLDGHSDCIQPHKRSS